MNARQREIGVLLSIGLSKMEYLDNLYGSYCSLVYQPLSVQQELLFWQEKQLEINYLQVLLQVLQNKWVNKQPQRGLGGGAEVDGFNKTLTSLEMVIQPTNVTLCRWIYDCGIRHCINHCQCENI